MKQVPPVVALIAWLVPPLLLLFQAGQLSRDWLLVRIVGFALSLYALVIIMGSVRALGRLLIPGLGVRHPLYSGAFALWLGAALGTLNWLLLALWPLAVAAVVRELPKEEEMLRAKFGAAYDAYAARTGRLVPGVLSWRGPAER